MGVGEGIGVVALDGPNIGTRLIEAYCVVVTAMEMALMWALKSGMILADAMALRKAMVWAVEIVRECGPT